jgi:LmbE family N-acetylglucosaminyl deacetylase
VRILFVSPHPDDAALSCGGLILRLREAGDEVTILTIFSAYGRLDRLTPYQRLALGFGEDGGPNDGGPNDRVPTPSQVMELRRDEDRAYARRVGAALIHLDLPDAVFRNYVGDEELMGEPKPGDPAPVAELATVNRDLRPERVYLPMAVGSHVDHRLARRAGIALSETGELDAEAVRFYEDFPYAHNLAFDDPAGLDAELAAAGLALEPELVAIDDCLERKVAGLQDYPSQLGRLFGGDDPMSRAVRERARNVGARAGLAAAERYWRVAGRAPRTRAAASS